MIIEKKILDNINRCYCTSFVTVDGVLKILMASEEIGGPCFAYYGEDFNEKEVVWENAGGTMSIVEIPGTNGEFLATQNFFPGFNAEKSKVVWGKYERGKWIIKDFLELPYLHRFDILQANGKRYFVGAALCGSKKDREDWSDPGKIWVGELPGDLNDKISIHPIKDNLTRNHGYCRAKYDNKEAGYVTSDEGIFVVIPPQSAMGEWEVKHIMEERISDVAIFDVDDDGIDELVTIGPFHGNEFKVYKPMDGEYKEVYKYPNEINFAHAVWAGNIGGKPTIIGGIRRMDCELFYVQYNSETKEYETCIIERGAGTANVEVVYQKDREVLLSANHTKNEAALYFFTH